MKKVVNIALDIETLSKRPTAAIIYIAAKAFSLGDNKVTGEKLEFKQAVDATSCVMLGLDIDPATVKWWSERPEKAKEQFSYSSNLLYVLMGLSDFIQKVKEGNEVEEVVLWCQGTDFDIAILRNAFVAAYNDRAEKHLPWKYANVRDSRTFIHEGVRLIDPSVDDPYSIIPKNPDWVEHDAMSDCNQLIHNVTWVNDKLTELLNTENSAHEPAE